MIDLLVLYLVIAALHLIVFGLLPLTERDELPWVAVIALFWPFYWLLVLISFLAAWPMRREH